MEEICYRPIGIIYSPFKDPKGVPIQPTFSGNVQGKIELFPEYKEGLKDLDGFSHIILIYHFHKTGKPKLIVTPFLDSKPKGVFSTRAPSRPNPIGISIVRLLRMEDSILYVSEIDIIDGTPLLDIKPYVPGFDIRKDAKAGWLEMRLKQPILSKDNGRFSKSSV